jgi:hypothetical protein
MTETKPVTKDKLTQVKFKVTNQLAAYMRFLGEEMGWGTSHTDVAKAVLLRELARLQEAEVHKLMPRLPEFVSATEDDEE